MAFIEPQVPPLDPAEKSREQAPTFRIEKVKRIAGRLDEAACLSSVGLALPTAGHSIILPRFIEQPESNARGQPRMLVILRSPAQLPII